MEKYLSKETTLSLPVARNAHVSTGWSRNLMLKAVGLASIAAALVGYKSCCHSTFATSLLGFSSKQANGGIAWSSCPDLTEFDCAYLSVPLNYLSPLPNETVSLALRRLPASAPKAERMGTLFINPGGPGGSGTAAIVNYGQDLNVILKGRYDILSWDPRGINMTTPALDCYPTNFDEWLGSYKQAQLGLPLEYGNNTLSWFEKLDAYYQADIESCAKNGNQKMLKASSTAYTARDIVSILQAIGEEERGLQYWGFSYGTILGATFAAMFPEYAYRMVLDGVANSNFFTNDPFASGRSAMDDTNKVWEGFLSECARAGPEACALAQTGFTTDDIRASMDDLIESLLAHPLPVPFSGKFSGIITASDIKTAIFQALYKPNKWVDLANAFADAKKGDGAALAAFIGEPALTERKDATDNVFKRHMFPAGMSRISNSAVMCGDADPAVAHSVDTPEKFMEYSKELAKLSVTGETWTFFSGRCRLWNTTAYEAYRGPWTVADGLKKTKYPVLFIGNTADPVTPLSAAKTMSKGFGNESATLLIQDGFGHCSTAHPSICTAKAIAAYFHDGVVPEYGTMCKSDDGFIFPTAGEKEQAIQALSQEDQEIMSAMRRLSERMAISW